ncbi:MAG: hypothetical protein ACLUR5_04935 [Eubacterium ventriosum]
MASLLYEQAMSKLDALMASARFFFTAGSLDYLKMGGRIMARSPL